MKYDCDSRRLRREAKAAERLARMKDWHPFFALFPIRVAPHDCRWLETVEEKWVPYMWCGHETGRYHYEYRAHAGR